MKSIHLYTWGFTPGKEHKIVANSPLQSEIKAQLYAKIVLGYTSPEWTVIWYPYFNKGYATCYANEVNGF